MTFSLRDLVKLIEGRNFCALATQGREGPHVAGVSYFAKGFNIYILSSANTTKVRNIRRDPHVAVHVSVPWPVVPAPPRSIQFRGTAEILPIDNADANAALAKAPLVLRRVMRHLLKNVDTEIWGENIWIRIRPTERVETFMVGVPVTTVFRDEKEAIRHFKVN